MQGTECVAKLKALEAPTLLVVWKNLLHVVKVNVELMSTCPMFTLSSRVMANRSLLDTNIPIGPGVIVWIIVNMLLVSCRFGVHSMLVLVLVKVRKCWTALLRLGPLRKKPLVCVARANGNGKSCVVVIVVPICVIVPLKLQTGVLVWLAVLLTELLIVFVLVVCKTSRVYLVGLLVKLPLRLIVIGKLSVVITVWMPVKALLRANVLLGCVPEKVQLVSAAVSVLKFRSVSTPVELVLYGPGTIKVLVCLRSVPNVRV